MLSEAITYSVVYSAVHCNRETRRSDWRIKYATDLSLVSKKYPVYCDQCGLLTDVVDVEIVKYDGIKATWVVEKSPIEDLSFSEIDEL